MQYSKAVYDKKISQYSIEHPLILKFWNLLSHFDEFLTSLLKAQSTFSLNFEDTITAILVLNWRIVMQDMGDIIVYDRSNKKLNLKDILSQLIVRYKWFIKHTVNYFLKLNTNNDISMKLSNIIQLINQSIEYDFSNFASISKRFVKQSSQPLPSTNENQINSLTKLEELREKASILVTKNVLVTTSKYNLMLNETEFNQKYIELRKEIRGDIVTENYEKLVEIYNCCLQNTTIKTELQLLPIKDIIGMYIISELRNCIFKDQSASSNEMCRILRKLTTIPPELNEILETYFDTRDKRLLSELTLLKTMYLRNAICLHPSYCLNTSIEIEAENVKELTMHLPVLCYSVSNLCVALDGSKNLVGMVNLGTFKDKSQQLRFLNEALWRSIPNFYSNKEYFMNNDAEYIINSYHSFVKLVELSLTGQNSNASISDVTEICIDKINSIYSCNKESEEMMKNKDKTIAIFKELSHEAEKLGTANKLEKVICIGHVYCLLNYIKALFNSQLQVIDPLEKNVLKKKYTEEERNICTNLRDAFIAQNEIYSGNTRTLHPFCAILSTNISNYLQKEIQLDKLVAVRPKHISYQSLLKDVHHDLNTLLSEDFFLKMYNKLKKCLSALQQGLATKCPINLEDCKDAFKQSLSWMNSQNNSFIKLSKYRAGYPDIIEALLCNLTELSYGIKLLSSTLQKLIIKYEHLHEDLSLLVKNLIQFPVLNSSQKNVYELIELCTDLKNINVISSIINDENIPNIAKQETLRLLKCSIQELYNLFVAHNPQYIESNNKMLVYLENLINLFVSAWYKQETEKKMKFEEEQSIYKTKSKCDDLTEEQEDLQNMKLLFPNYHEIDFSDFQQRSLEDTDNPTDSDDTTTEFVGIITMDDVKFVADIHSELMQLFTRSEWLNPKKKQLDFDFLTPLLERYKLFTLIENQLINGLDSDIEYDLIASLNVLVAAAKNYGEGEDIFVKINGSPRKSKEKCYDFYKDSKVEEVKSCLHIIEALKLRTDELLNEWPGHPTLQSIRAVIERIYLFSITSPVSRFLTGFEILLSKCHEWEENAHSGVTLSEYLQNITLQIISWRKLELAGWKDCLTNSAQRIKNSVAKWWFHIYTTIQEFTYPDETNKDIISAPQMIKTFQEFIEKSPLGEFESRLELLYTFHCHALHLPKTGRTDIVISILWNLYNFYSQFLNNVDLKIKNQRTPIEKKLKDFVKIARWNDINYWAVKETVEKTHKTLHKYIKEFEGVLKQSVTECLVNTNSDAANSENVGIWDRPTRQNPREYHYTLDVSNYMASVKFKKLLNENPATAEQHPHSLLNKSEKYFTKSRNLCKDTILATTYPNLIQNLDLFVAEIIETSNHLRNLEVNTELEKPKQKSQAKSILQQKRKALADLFKALAKCGLSYKTGLIEAKLREDQSTEFLLKPIDLKASFGHIKTKGACDKQLLNVWDGCETYFMRTIARLSALETALKQPAKDLGFQNIERCKGFSAHLMVLAQDQKAKLIDSSRNLYYLRNYINLLTECGEEFEIIETATIKSINNLLTNLIIVMEQYKIILHACPEKSNFDSDVLDIPIANAEHEILIKYKNEADWNSACAQIKNITTLAQKLKKSLDKLEHVFPASEIRIEATAYLFVQDKVSITADLNELSQKTKQLQETLGNKSLTNSLMWLLGEFEASINTLQTNHLMDDDEQSNISVEKYTRDVEKLMEHILVIIQNVYKKYDALKKESEVKPIEGEEEPEERTELFDDNHLKSLVIENLFTDLSTLEMKSIFRRMKKLLEKLYKMNGTNSARCKTLLSSCVPLLEQVTLTYQYFVTQQISAYRVTCKLTSVLLNIFVELATKGFCVPEEFSDELNSEGQSTQQSGGMGLGEGEGEKDVSDRIESEDQLDDAQPAGQEKKNEDKDCKEEDKGIEMSEDFEGKLQDVDKNPDDESQSDDDSDAEKQMGDTEPESNKLDQQIWGSDEEEEENDDEEAGEDQSGKQDKEEKGEGGELEDQQMAAKEEGSKPNEEEDDTRAENKEKQKEQQKDINEMDEPEFDEEQTDPYHGNQPPLPEPEPMDLPDDLQLDDGEEKEEQGEENPFDIDSMKDQMPPEEETQADDADGKEKDETKATEDDDKANDTDSSDEGPSEMDPEAQEKAEEEEENKDTSGLHEKQEDKEDENSKIPEDEENKTADENEDASALDNQQSKEDEIQPMDVDNIESADNVQTNPNKSKAENPDQVSQEENNEKEGVGQSQMEEADSGHRGEVNAAKDSLSAQHEKEVPKEKRQRPGEADSDRTLGESAEPIKKKLKTIDIQDANEDDDDDNEEDEAEGVDNDGKDSEMYQHIKEAKETDTQVMDAATKEQAETQKIQTLEDTKEEDKSEEPVTDVPEMDVDEPEPEPVDTPKQKAEQTENKSQKKADGKQQQGDIVEEIKDVEIEGDLVETMNVPRGTDSSYHTQYELFNETQVERLSTVQIEDLRSELESQLGTWKEPPPNQEAEQSWEKFSAITTSLARDLSEQLRLVLEPTQASRLRGDFRTGRRINMRKVIPYIASQFRKDKIWLRRTKPSKRDYQIVLAIDDSSSMDDNHSKELAFESVALISKALTLLESGQLSVLSFGETTEILHKLTDTFTEKSGVKLLQKFQFQQKKTCVANLVDFVATMFGDAHTSAPNAKLLIVVSDGRGIFSEGETFVQQAIRRAKFANIFMVFVIIDNPENKNSILDIRMPVFKDGKLLGIKSYLDHFPFPFYIILRDINTLPTVLSDALRQWFELVTNVDS